jgi:phosphoribosyl 1,2-cyclic phosphodiesterase
MKLSLWGVRGSIATPGPETVRYGGNTTCLCLEVGGRFLVFDAGTGARPLGNYLVNKEKRLTIDMFITHSHTDHICGFPFFFPLYNPENQVNVYGRLHYEKSVEEVLATQMDYSYFPLRAVDLPSKPNFLDLDGSPVQLDDVKITYQMMNHPVLMQAYRVEHAGRSFVFTGDMEPYDDIFESDESQEVAINRNGDVIDFFRGADVLVIDATYTHEEYEKKRGWGHNSIHHAVWFAGEAGVKHVIFTHHEPIRTDEDVDDMLQMAEGIRKKYDYHFDHLEMAAEGRVIEW